ncbi:aldo/keto reductase [Bacillus sp. REN10]|uniref:aldo/keto reductase n=1 Tax=Bacillus sp. REN10 TaxID=2782541 RepID=UPI00193B1C78|nr:aldo/keto reductase [Bacillus sp. REN10]
MNRIKNLQAVCALHNGVEIPYVGLGVYKMTDEEEAYKAITSAIETGYRLIDTAAFYNNEHIVGKAIQDSQMDRKDVFITSKVWNSDQGFDETLRAFEKSLKQLHTDYMDLYLVHWPVKGKYKETWRALERLYKEGTVRAIGVSNFHIHHLEDLLAHSQEKPVVNQVELHPYLSQVELRNYCQTNHIAIEAWSPIARNRLADEPVLNHLAAKHGKTVSQIILRWHLQNNTVIIPKSVHPERIKENADLFDFELTTEDMRQINALNKNKRFGADPDNFDF